MHLAGVLRLTNINFNKSPSLTKIEKYAFAECSKLTKIVFPVTLKTIDNGAFIGCTSLTNIIFPEDLTVYWFLCLCRMQNLLILTFLITCNILIVMHFLNVLGN